MLSHPTIFQKLLIYNLSKDGISRCKLKLTIMYNVLSFNDSFCIKEPLDFTRVPQIELKLKF